MNAKTIINDLKKYQNSKNIAGMKRFGINGKNILGGPNIPTLRKMAKKIIKDADDRHRISLDLWDSEIHEARILAAMIDEPKKVTEKQMDDWIKDFDSWDLCDQVCLNLFDKVDISWKKAEQWSKRKPEFEKRAGFALMAVLAWHEKTEDRDSKLIQFLPIIKAASTDGRNYVKKAVNWALREIGKRNEKLKIEAIKTAEEIAIINNKSSRWIAADALRELKK